MKRLALMLSLIAIPAVAQQAPTANHACVVLKRMGPADEVTSHLYSFGIRGKQFQYVEGDFPKHMKFHGRLTDNDVRHILDNGGKVEILEPKYTDTDLDSARKRCSGQWAGAGDNQTAGPSDKVPENQTAVTPQPAAVNVPAAAVATVSVSSDPNSADVYADGAFIGNAPATLKLSPGKHTVRVSMSGFKDWSREIVTEAGSEAHLVANLEKLD